MITILFGECVESLQIEMFLYEVAWEFSVPWLALDYTLGGGGNTALYILEIVNPHDI